MEWVILIASGVLEAVWATALGATRNFRRLWPTVLFIVALALSMAGLAFAMNAIPVGTAYAVWVGIGAVLTVAYAMIFGTEKVSVVKILLPEHASVDTSEVRMTAGSLKDKVGGGGGRPRFVLAGSVTAGALEVRRASYVRIGNLQIRSPWKISRAEPD